MEYNYRFYRPLGIKNTTIMFIKWIIILLAVLNFGFMVFDGSRALATGDYIRPKAGQHAGQLGPWSKAVSTIGINPEGTPMKVIFVLWGLAGLYITYAFLQNKPWAWQAMLVFNIASLWYAMMGTMSSVIQIALLIISKMLR
jgi:hypothetical protein